MTFPVGIIPVLSPSFRISQLFADGLYAGFDFTDLDPAKVWGSDPLALLYQASNANSAVSASGQTVGALLDKSRGVDLAADTVVNGGFSADTDWTKGTGWSISGGKASIDGSNGSASNLSQATLPASGDYFRVRFTMANRSAGSATPILGASGAGNARSTNAAHADVIRRAGGSATTLFMQAGASSTLDLDDVSARLINGNHASQASSSARPAYTESGAQKWLNFDGSDDALQSTLVPAASMTVAACVRVTSASKVIIGSTAGGDTRSFLSINASGQASGGVGADAFSTIAGGSDIRGSDAVILLRYNGSVVELWLNGARVYQAAQNGTPNTSVAYYLGAQNSSGATNVPMDGRIYGAFAVQRFIPDFAVIPLMRQLRDEAGLTSTIPF